MYSDEFRGRFPVCPGERHTGSVEVIGSIPTVSTNDKKDRELLVLCPFLFFCFLRVYSGARVPNLFQKGGASDVIAAD